MLCTREQVAYSTREEEVKGKKVLIFACHETLLASKTYNL
jgi:hypothetical protein